MNNLAVPGRPRPEAPRDRRYGLAWLRLAIIGCSAVVAWVFALAFSANWDSHLRFRYGGNYGLQDPLFSIDIGFYLFHLPFYETEQGFLAYLSFVTLVAVVAVYFVEAWVRVSGGRHQRNPGHGPSHIRARLFSW